MNCSTEIGDGNSMFNNTLYSNNQENKYYKFVCKDLIENMFKYHTDFENINNGLTSIYYVNTNNGGTEFENGKFVKSEKGKIVTFPMNTKHKTIAHTDFSYARIVININYTKD
jgi:hypothetical protein